MTVPVCLVAMPWQSLDTPSLPIGLLTAVAKRAGVAEPAAYYANLRWAEFLMAATGDRIGPDQYQSVADDGIFDELGDWVFTGVLHDDPDFGVPELSAYAAEHGVDIATAATMREHAAAFVDLVTAEVLELRPALVGFTSTFMQNVPSLSVAKRLKQFDPGIRIVFGGGNCDGPMGAAIHRNYRFVDFVVRGEGEDAFPALLSALASGDPLDGVPGLCWRRPDGGQECNAMPPPLPASRIPVPDFTDWFDRVEASPVNEHIEPKLTIETARGCWWGEKHHCTFCGLNGTLMKFRSKEPDAVLAELGELVRRHRALDVIVVDNIIDNSFLTTVLPRIAGLGWDLRIHYEVKSNLKPEEIRALHDAGVCHIQPGIESLVKPVLKIMEKGVAPIRNIRTLRDGESTGLTVSWNWLYGFPGERAGDYAPVLRQMPRLVHLQPPSGAARIVLERFSPYFSDTALGFPERTTAKAYRHVYDLAEEDMRDMVYLFDTPPRGLTDADAKELNDVLDAWKAGYHDSSLIRTEEAGVILIEDRRVGWPAAGHRIDDPALCAAYMELEHGRSVPALLRHLADSGHLMPEAELVAWLDGLDEAGLVYGDHGQWIALATTSIPVKVK
ncbi:MAG TPA: RiPP maturation radical SAM C-methyltransferase [Streptosporangiaceae bacterium]|jgi:ribosomal peptide maturation radical SAM protein 1|nr:RiPP maturation radical SAM C-methyltransferase [Streptosporangiaceae bacterium]